MSEFKMSSAITTATRTWIDAEIRSLETAAKRADKFVTALADNYPEDTGKSVKASLSSAVKNYTAGRGATSGQQSAASKMVATARMFAGLKRAGVDVDKTFALTIKVGEHEKRALPLVINGEGGKPWAEFRKSIVAAADAGKFADIPALIKGAKPVTEAEAAAAETGEAASADNGTEASTNVSAAVDAVNLVRTLATVAGLVAESAVEFTAEDNDKILEALAALEAAVHSHTPATV